MNKTITVEERVNALKNHLVNTYAEGRFKANSSSFNDVLHMNSNNIYYIKKLAEEGFIRCAKPAERINGKWTMAEYEIIHIVEENKEKESKLDVNDYIEDNFNNISMILYKTENEYVVPVSSVYKAIGLNAQAVYDMLDNYKELFEPHLLSVTLNKSEKGNPHKKCLTRDGVIGLLMKISYNRLPEDKKKLVIEFQKWAIEKLGKLISNGKVELPEQEHSQVQNNIGSITGMTEDEVDKIFNEFEEGFNKFFENTKSMIKTSEEKRKIAESRAEDLNKQNQKWIAKTQAMMNKMHSMNVV